MGLFLFSYCCWGNQRETQTKEDVLHYVICIGSTNHRKVRLLDPLKSQLGLFVELRLDQIICDVGKEASCL